MIIDCYVLWFMQFLALVISEPILYSVSRYVNFLLHFLVQTGNVRFTGTEHCEVCQCFTQRNGHHLVSWDKSVSSLYVFFSNFRWRVGYPFYCWKRKGERISMLLTIQRMLISLIFIILRLTILWTWNKKLKVGSLIKIWSLLLCS